MSSVSSKHGEIEVMMSLKMKNALSSFGEEVARSVIEVLSSKYGFPVEEAYSCCSIKALERGRGERESRPSSRVSTRSSATPPMVALPFCGKAVEGWCSGIRVNGGLYTQCSNEPDGDSPYCATCQRQASKNKHGLPNGGDVGDRIAKGDEWRCPKGKEPVRLANYLKKSGKVLTDELREQIKASAETFGWTIADSDWVVKSGPRGRPRVAKTAVVDTTATEDEGNKSSVSGKKTARKAKKMNAGSELENASDSSDGEELVLAPPKNSSLMQRRSASPPSPGVVEQSVTISPIEGDNAVSISPVELKEAPKPKKPRKPKMTPEEKEAAKAAKAAEKLAEKEATKAAKLAEKEAAKAAKAAAKLAEKEAAKAAKLAEKEAAKAAKAAAKLAEKEAAKAAKLAEKKAGKEKVASPSSPSPSDDGDGSAHKQCAHNDSDGNRCSTPSEGDGNTHCIKHSTPEPAVPADPEHDVYEAETEDEGGSDDEDAASVEEFEHKGKKYLRDPKTNDIFNHAVFLETGEAEEIGVYNPDTDEIEFHDDD